jgi:hypothetical protein
VGPFMTVNFNVYVEASYEGYSNLTMGPFMTVHYNGLVEASKQGYS